MTSLLQHRYRSVLVAAAIAAATFAVGAAPARAEWRLQTAWGSQGSGGGQFGTGQELVGGDRQFDDPAGVAIDRGGNLVVADPSNNRIEKFSSTGRSLGAFGRFGFARGVTDVPGRLDLPEGLTLGPGNTVVVSDNRNDRVEVFNSRGRARAVMGGRGAFPGEMVSPMGLAVRKGIIYVIDQGSYRIEKFSLRGRYRGAFGHFGTKGCGFVFPYALAITPRGNIYITDTGRGQVTEFTATGRCLRTIGSPGTGPAGFSHPTGIAFDRSGNLLVADNYNDSPPRGGGGLGGCVHHLTPTGAPIDSFGQGSLESPTYLAAGPGGSVYVSDFRRIVKFASTASGGDQLPCGAAAPCRFCDQGPPPDDSQAGLAARREAHAY